VAGDRQVHLVRTRVVALDRDVRSPADVADQNRPDSNRIGDLLHQVEGDVGGIERGEDQ
jgi:hypothetical protein